LISTSCSTDTLLPSRAASTSTLFSPSSLIDESFLSQRGFENGSADDDSIDPDPEPQTQRPKRYERYSDSFDSTFDTQSEFRWMWGDAKRNPLRWSFARSARSTAMRLQHYKDCARPVSLEICGQTKSAVVMFANVNEVLSYFDDMATNDSGLMGLNSSSTSVFVGPDDPLWHQTQGSFLSPSNGEGGNVCAEDEIDSIRWMWGDADVRCCFCKRMGLESPNPFRWSGRHSLQTTIDHLQRYQSDICARPVRMEIVFRRRGRPDVIMYPTVTEALNDLHKRYRMTAAVQSVSMQPCC